MNKASYFWLEERDILPGNGFTLWGSSHKTVIVVILFFIAVSIIAFERVKGRYKELIMRSLAVLLPLLEVLKIAVLSAHGRMDIGHLPIHFVDSCPQFSQTYAILSFAMLQRYYFF